MSVEKLKGPVFDPGLCRCCGTIRKCRVLNAEYEWMAQKEVYSDMIMDCFGLLLSHLDGKASERLVCATCVRRLREAGAFRRQVLQCEEAFLQMKMYDADSEERQYRTEQAFLEGAPKVEVAIVKAEPEEPGSPAAGDALAVKGLAKYSEIVEVEIKTEVCVEVETKDGSREVANGDDAAVDDDDTTDHVDKGAIDDIKDEPLIKSTKRTVKTERKKLIKVGVQQNRNGNRETRETSKTKKEMLVKMKKISEKLKKMEKIDPAPKLSSTAGLVVKRPRILDNDVKSFRNTVTIVENSYVCPFDTTFSDYYCIYCRELFTDPGKLREHTFTHDPSTYKDIVANKKMLQIDILRIDCRLCTTTIDDLDSFKAHITGVHGKVLYDIPDEFLKFRLTINHLKCTECDNTFGFFHALRQHMAEHFGTCICDVCGAHYFEERTLLKHQRTHQRVEEIHSCKECGKSFKSKHSLFFHVARIHKKEPAYQCSKCDAVLLSYALRYRHMIEVHGEQRIFPCEHCDRVYDSRKARREHNRRSHLKIYKHQCDLCDRRFYLPCRLKEHMVTHTGERNHRCEYCGKSYPRLRALKVHMQSHSNEKKYRCVLCNASFTQNVSLKNHMKRQHQTLDMDSNCNE